MNSPLRFVVLLLAVLMIAGAAAALTPGAQLRSTMPIGGRQNFGRELDEIMFTENFEGVINWTPMDDAEQTVYWQTDDWMPFAGNNAWRCFLPGYGNPTNGGYKDSWQQMMVSPDMNLASASTSSLSFQFRIYAEIPNWDGANVWVFYGNDPNNLMHTLVTPTSPVYNQSDLWAFEMVMGNGQNWPGWSGEAAPFGTNYTQATFNLNAYTGYSHVMVALAFFSDGAVNTLDDPARFGFQVDNILWTANGNPIWGDDADGGNIGGPPTYLTGASAYFSDLVPNVWDTRNNVPGAPSPTHAAGVISIAGFETTPFVHYYVSPPFDLDPLGPGESYTFDTWIYCQMEYAGAPSAEDELWWDVDAYSPVTDSWGPVEAGTDYVYVGPWDPWVLFSSNQPTDLSYLEDQQGIRLRLAFHNPDENRAFQFLYMDDVIVEKLSLQHDIATMLDIPYPCTVGVDVYGKVYLTNNGPNTESGFTAVWDDNGSIYPLIPVGPYTIDGEETLELSINDPTDPEHTGYWVPPSAGAYALNAYHTLASDEIPDNDAFPVDVDVMTEGNFEFGTDSRNFYGLLSIPQGLGSGPVVHLDPSAINPDVVAEGTAYDVNMLVCYMFYWDDGSTGGAPADPQMDFKVYAGGATPGAVIYQGTFMFPIAPGYSGAVTAALDVSGVPEMQGLIGDYWVQPVVTQMDQNGVYAQPMYYRTGANSHQETQFSSLANAQNGNNITDYGHHITMVVDNVVAVDEPSETTVPSRYALGQAYPNPFNPTTTISFDVARAGHVSLIVYNVLGEEVARIADRDFRPGSYTETFNAASLSSGLYFVRMEAADFSAVSKIMLMK